MINSITKIVSRLVLIAIVALVHVSSYGAGTAGADTQESVFHDRDKKAIETIINDYLLEHPEVILRALQVLEERKQAAKATKVKNALAKNRAALERDTNTPVAGNPNGDVTVVEFFDYRCPYCKRVGPAIQRLLKEDSNIRVVFKEWPILGPDSYFAAKAALGAREQGKYIEFHEKIMATRHVTESNVLKAAKELGIDLDKLRKDMKSPKVERHIKQSMGLARDLGIKGTPAFVIDDRLIPGATTYAALVQAVAEARARKDKIN